MNKSKAARSWFRTLELILITMIALGYYNNALFWTVWGFCLLINIVIDWKEEEDVK